ncbi:conserved hypothetical protein [Haloferula helveola]|uniref:Uncharacterized protein n=1 Tax=Haloferula helveola TaxID=490095 RepID=A0ABM7RM88_9BACT|nr:conserved hypothetical protein [Haloferula helveola]
MQGINRSLALACLGLTGVATAAEVQLKQITGIDPEQQLHSEAASAFSRESNSWNRGFRTASTLTHSYITGWTTSTEGHKDGFISKVDPASGTVVWTKAMKTIMGPDHGWQINDIEISASTIYVCGTRTDNTGFVASLTTDGVLIDYTQILAKTGTDFPNSYADARTLTVQGGKVIVGGSALGASMEVNQKWHTSGSTVFGSLVLACKSGNDRFTDAWVIRFNADLSADWGTTYGFPWCDDYSTAVAADDTGAIFLALKFKNPDANGNAIMDHIDDDGRRIVTAANPNGTLIPSGVYNNYNFWWGSWPLLLRIDTTDALARSNTSYFTPCKLESLENTSHSEITEVLYHDGSLYVAGDWNRNLRPVAHGQEAQGGQVNPYSLQFPDNTFSHDIWVARLNATNLHHQAWRLYQSAGDDFVSEMTVAGDSLYLAGRAGGSLSTKNSLATSATATELGGSSKPHLFWERISMPDLSRQWHVVPTEDASIPATIPGEQHTTGIAFAQNKAILTGSWTNGSFTMGEAGNATTLPNPPANFRRGFVAFIDADGSLLENYRITINSEFGPTGPGQREMTAAIDENVTLRAPKIVYQNAAGDSVDPNNSELINNTAVTRFVCTGYQFKNSTVNGTANEVNFVASSDTEITFLWRTEHAIEIDSDLDGTDGLTSTAAGDPDPVVKKHWIAEDEPFTAFIDGAESTSTMPGTRWVSTGYVATGCVADVANEGVDGIIEWPAYQDRQQTPKIIVSQPGSITWRWKKQHQLRVSANSSVAADAPQVGTPSPLQSTLVDIQPGVPSLSVVLPESGEVTKVRLVHQDPARATVSGYFAPLRFTGSWTGPFEPVSGLSPQPSGLAYQGLQEMTRSADGSYSTSWRFIPWANSSQLAYLDTTGLKLEVLEYVRQSDGATVVTTDYQSGSGEYWIDQGTTVELTAPASVSSGTSVLSLKGYTGGQGSVSPFDGPNITSKFVTITRPSVIIWDYARAIYKERVVIGSAVNFSTITGIDATNVNRFKRPETGTVSDAGEGSTWDDMQDWDEVNRLLYALQPGSFTVEFENTAAPDDPAQNVIVQVEAVWPETSSYTHILEAPPVELDPTATDGTKFLRMAYTEGGGYLTGSKFAASEPGRSILLFSKRAGGIATGNTTQESLVVKVVNSIPWAASAAAEGNFNLPATIGQAIETPAHDLTTVGHNGYILTALAPINAGIYDSNTLQGPIIPVNEPLPAVGDRAGNNDPNKTRLFAGHVVEFDSTEDLLLDPAKAVIAVSMYGDSDRSVRGVTFRSDRNASNQAVEGSVTVTTTANNYIDNWKAAPTFSGANAAALGEIMRDIRYQSNGPVTSTIEGLVPGNLYHLQLLTNEGMDWSRFCDISINGSQVADNYSSEGGTETGGSTASNSFAYTVEARADASGTIVVVMQPQIGGNPPPAGNDPNPLLNALVVHRVGEVNAIYSPEYHEPAALAVAWYRVQDGIRWPYTAARYLPSWPSNPERIVIASRLGSEGTGKLSQTTAYTYEEQVADTDPTWNRPRLDKSGIEAGAVHYRAYSFTPLVNNSLAFFRSPQPFDVYLYDGIFNPSNPLENLVATHGPSNAGWTYVASVQTGKTYSFVVSQIGEGDPLGSFDLDIQGGARTFTAQDLYTAPGITAPSIYSQPDPASAGFNPNEEHGLIAPSFLETSRFAAFALHNDFNRTARDESFTSQPYVLVDYVDATDAANPVARMKVYQVVEEDAETIDPRLPSSNQAYTFFYEGIAGTRLVPPHPLDTVLAGHPTPVETEGLNVGGRISYYEDKNDMPWVVSGDTDPEADILAVFHYPMRADFWHPAAQPGDPVPFALPTGARPLNISFNTVWPQPVATLKAGETLTFAGGEYSGDHSGDLVPPPGLPGVVAWKSGKTVFDSMNPSLDQGVIGTDYLARLFPALDSHEVDFPLGDLPEALLPASGNLIVEGLIWRFKDLPAGLQDRIYYDSSTHKLGVRGVLNGRILGDGDLLVTPGAQTILQPNVLTSEDEAILAALGGGNWPAAATELAELSRNPEGVAITGSLGIGLTPAEIGGGAVPASALGTGLAVITNPRLLDSTSGLSGGYVTLAENDDPALDGLPVAMHVIRVETEKYRGSVAVMEPGNVFDEKVSLRHTADFGGDVADLYFEWVMREEDGRELNPPGIDKPTYGTPLAGEWPVFREGLGLNEVQLAGSGPSLISDQLVFCRYRHRNDPTGWSAWAGAANSREPDPASPSVDIDAAYVAQLIPGWIKRVTDAVNLFDARYDDFRNSGAPATYTSAIQQAGQRHEGPVAFNPDKDAIENVGLIELYQTVLDRGEMLTIDGLPGTEGVNAALLNAANRISGLYVLLGNEAYADLQDPTVGYATVGGEFGTLAPTIHAFENQTANLIDEELAMVRGRAETGARPSYNRLLWNFTNGAGEAAYVLNYGIDDLTNDGFIDDEDARRLYPQGHGDAWGHYTMALKGYYDLATRNNFQWTPRSEKYHIDGIVLDVDYLDERAFAKAAAARATCGAEWMDLVYRKAYTENPNAQWQGYKDSNSDRAWGVFETAQRTGTAALCDWLTANAMLKGEETDPQKTGIRKVDRTTVGELRLIAASASSIQAKLDSSDRGLNPAGLDPNIVPFDIDPNLTTTGTPVWRSHFEQLYDRAVDAAANASRSFDHASEIGLQLRRTEATTETLRQAAIDQDLALRNRLIEYYGTPYAGMIGPGKAYPSGYSGPDLYLFMYVDQVSAGGDILDPLTGEVVETTIVPGLHNLVHDTNPFEEGGVGVDGALMDSVSKYFPADMDLPSQDVGSITLDLPRAAEGYALVAPDEWAERRSPGKIQAAIQDLVHAQWRVRMAVNAYESQADDFRNLLKRFELKTAIAADNLTISRSAGEQHEHWVDVATTMYALSTPLLKAADSSELIWDAVAETMPTSVGLSVDATAPARGVVKANAAIQSILLNALSLPLEIAQYRAELEADAVLVDLDRALLEGDLKSEIVDLLGEINDLVNSESDALLAVIDALESMRAASDRVRTTIGDAEAILEERVVFNQRVASTTTQLRYEDYTFRTFHHDALRKYRSSFDLAARYAYLAGKAYQYELNLGDFHAANASPLLAEMLRTRTLGQWDGGEPVLGQGGLAECLALLDGNFQALKGQMGLNQSSTEITEFSLRRELARVGMSSRVNGDWQTKLETWRVPDLWNYEYQENGVNYGYVFRRYCRPFSSESAGAQPALVIPFTTTIEAGKNWFGLGLAGGDSTYNASNFSTKIRSVGVRFDGYNNTALSQTPQAYFIPVGQDRMFLPNSGDLEFRSWQVADQRIPAPLPIGTQELTSDDWQPYSGSADGHFEDLRKFSSFRAYHDAGGWSSEEMLGSSRLLGRSAWNSRWVLIIPSNTLLYDAANGQAGLDTLIYGAPLPGFDQSTAGTALRDQVGIRDIRLLLQTYSASGN